MTEQETDRWLDVLAGTVQATDHGTRQAASLRDFYVRQMAAEVEIPPDVEGEKRFLNMLRARGAFAPGSSKVEPVPGIWARLSGWLFPVDGKSTGRYAAAAALGLALVVGPWALHQSTPVDDDSSIKGGLKLPPVSSSSSGETVVLSAQPQRDAADLTAALTRLGVIARLRASGADSVVSATVGPDREIDANAILATYGAAVSATGEIRIVFRALP